MTEEELKNRLKSAFVILRDGGSFQVGDLAFGCNDKNIFRVVGFTNCIELNLVTRQGALTELNEIKSLFAKMVKASSELAEFIASKEIEYYLDFDDYGKCSIDICSEKNGQIKWKYSTKE